VAHRERGEASQRAFGFDLRLRHHEAPEGLREDVDAEPSALPREGVAPLREPGPAEPAQEAVIGRVEIDARDDAVRGERRVVLQLLVELELDDLTGR
jgi:hypothetical protein